MPFLRAAVRTVLLALLLGCTVGATPAASFFYGEGNLSIDHGFGSTCTMGVAGSATIDSVGGGNGWVTQFDSSYCSGPMRSLSGHALPWSIEFDSMFDHAYIPLFEGNLIAEMELFSMTYVCLLDPFPSPALQYAYDPASDTATLTFVNEHYDIESAGAGTCPFAFTSAYLNGTIELTFM